MVLIMTVTIKYALQVIGRPTLPLEEATVVVSVDNERKINIHISVEPSISDQPKFKQTCSSNLT